MAAARSVRARTTASIFATCWPRIAAKAFARSIACLHLSTERAAASSTAPAARRASRSATAIRPGTKISRHGILALYAPDAPRQERKLRLLCWRALTAPRMRRSLRLARLSGNTGNRIAKRFLCSFGLRLKRDIPSITTTLNPKGRMPPYRALRRACSAWRSGCPNQKNEINCNFQKSGSFRRGSALPE